jgi:hypothetical protein
MGNRLAARRRGSMAAPAGRSQDQKGPDVISFEAGFELKNPAVFTLQSHINRL